MLTDIFLNRYIDVPLWTAFEERDRKFLVQAFRIVEEQVYPYYHLVVISETAKQKWKVIHDRLSTELGLRDLSQHYYSYEKTFNGQPLTHSGFFEWNYVCQQFVCKVHQDPLTADQFMKERISFFEIALREFYKDVTQSNKELPKRVLEWNTVADRRTRRGITVPKTSGNSSLIWPEVENRNLNDRYNAVVEEFNTRSRQARYPLNYHNGFVQISKDDIAVTEVEQPFWNVVSDPIWKNVDTDMKEALDRRDTNQRDPAFYAARALESTIKIISDQKGWTHGREKGSHNFLDNLGGSKNGGFIDSWERQALKDFFTNVRNPFAHGPGGATMPELTPTQTNWAIETCMVWIKTLIRRM